MKNKNNNFYVQRNTPLNNKGIIYFQLERLNVGGAMDLSSGDFTVPSNGTYHFKFPGVKKWSTPWIFLSHFKWTVFMLVGPFLTMDDTMKKAYSTASLTSSLKLKVGDRVSLWKNEGELYDTDNEHFAHFTGWLVDEDIILV